MSDKDATTQAVESLARLVKIAQGDTGQCRRVANFLLSWWNAETCGGFDMTDLWALDTEICHDMLRVFSLVASRREYPDYFVPECRDVLERLAFERNQSRKQALTGEDGK